MHVAEIFESFHGEVNGHHQGRLVTFVRLSGCNLKCSYCDTAKTQDPYYGLNLTKEAIIQQIENFDNTHVCLTGGEPLLNTDEVRSLLYRLYKKGFKISVETNGTIPIAPFRKFVQSFIIDYKINFLIDVNKPYFLHRNLDFITEQDVIKFIIGHKDDYNQAKKLIKGWQDPLLIRPIFALSPMSPKLSGEDLAKMILNDKIPNIVLSLQIHKILNCR